MTYSLKRFALTIADLLLAYVANGDHTHGYADSLSDARRAVGYVRGVFYPKRKRPAASYWKAIA